MRSWWLEEKQLLKEKQCGFKPRRGTLDILAQIGYHIYDTYRKKQVMTILFVDLEGAFDTAVHEDILYKLAKMGLTGTTLTWITNFLTIRTFQVPYVPDYKTRFFAKFKASKSKGCLIHRK